MRTPVILLHGWGFTPSVWAPVIDALVGLGVSRDSISAPALPFASGDLQPTIAALASQLPTRVHIVGWSLGGELALALANHAPKQVASLTMIASTPCFMNRDSWTPGQPESLLDDFDQRLVENPTTLLKRFSMLIRHGDTAAGRDRTLADSITQASETDPHRLAAGLRLLRDVDLRTTTAVVPTSILHGTHDAVVPIAAAEWLAERTQAPLTKIEGASHAVPLTHAVQIAEHLHCFTEQHA